MACCFHRYWAYSSKSTVRPKMESCFQDGACSVCYLLHSPILMLLTHSMSIIHRDILHLTLRPPIWENDINLWVTKFIIHCKTKAPQSRTPSWAGLWTLIYMPSIYGNDIPTGGPWKEEPQGSPCLKEYPIYLCNQIESYILLCLLGYDHKPIDNCPLLTT